MHSPFNSVRARLSTFCLMLVSLHRTSRSSSVLFVTIHALEHCHSTTVHRELPSAITCLLAGLPMPSYVAPYPTNMSAIENVAIDLRPSPMHAWSYEQLHSLCSHLFLSPFRVLLNCPHQVSIITHQQPLLDYLSHPTTLYFFSMCYLFNSISARLSTFCVPLFLLSCLVVCAEHLGVLSALFITICALEHCRIITSHHPLLHSLFTASLCQVIAASVTKYCHMPKICCSSWRKNDLSIS
jgi:hypothetical protein